MKIKNIKTWLSAKIVGINIPNYPAETFRCIRMS
ncbi:hypothetical protein GGP83_003287 [Salinibacter ruber]|uniref:Uncharacterized protein n=1 Tax=Salinibacter ruber TaxID=146919 RepID=A0A9X2UBA7_9BACT|nr:hypothetical protein [Salinibacter ruber]